MKADSRIVHLGRFLFAYRSFTPVPVILAIFILFKPMDLGALNPVAALVGLFCALAGETVRVIAVGFSAPGTSGRESVFRADELNSAGLYSVTRNPLYIGNLFIYSGLLIVYANPWALGLMIAFLLVQYHAIIRAEEQFLSRRYGDAYHAYMDAVPRFLCRFVDYKAPARRFDMRRVLFKEKDSLFNLLFMFLVVLGLREIHLHGELLNPQPLFAAALILIAAYAAVHYLKRRSGR